MIKPNLFIVGAPKCGTTSLSEYLKSHPNIFFSTPKEPHFFAKDMNAYRFCSTEKEYLKIFTGASESQRIIGEASVLYLYSSSAINEIYHFNPSAKLIVMLRNPIDLIYSYHSQLLINTDEVVEDFETAWKLEPVRRKGNQIPKTCRINKLLEYSQAGRLGSQVERLLNIFPKEQVHFIFMDDFKSDTLSSYKNALNFLDIEYDGRIDFPVINDNKKYRSNKLSRLKKNKFFVLGRKIKNIIGLKDFAVMEPFYKMNIKNVEREPLRGGFRQELIIEFTPEVEKLERILEVNLSHWKK